MNYKENKYAKVFFVKSPEENLEDVKKCNNECGYQFKFYYYKLIDGMESVVKKNDLCLVYTGAKGSYNLVKVYQTLTEDNFKKELQTNEELRGKDLKYILGLANFNNFINKIEEEYKAVKIAEKLKNIKKTFESLKIYEMIALTDKDVAKDLKELKKLNKINLIV